jgi:hypothetical protein
MGNICSKQKSILHEVVSLFKWKNNCYLMPTQQFFSYIKLFSMRWWGPFCTRPTHLIVFHSASLLKQQSADRHVPHSDTLFWFRANQSLLLLLNAVCLAEKQQISILKSLVWPDLGSNPRFNALETSTLTITPLMQFS